MSTRLRYFDTTAALLRALSALSVKVAPAARPARPDVLDLSVYATKIDRSLVPVGEKTAAQRYDPAARGPESMC